MDGPDLGSARFTLGTKEKHVILVDYWGALWFGRTEIVVDGKEVVNGQHWWLGPRSYHFDVGDSEPHKVELRIGTLGRKFELYVDGEFAGSA